MFLWCFYTLDNRLYSVFLFAVELEQMLSKDRVLLNDFESSTFSQPWLLKLETEVIPDLLGHLGSGSGGYSDHIFHYAAKELFGSEFEQLEYKQLRYFLFYIFIV